VSAANRSPIIDPRIDDVAALRAFSRSLDEIMDESPDPHGLDRTASGESFPRRSLP
jgi:hypothetical protein